MLTYLSSLIHDRDSVGSRCEGILHVLAQPQIWIFLALKESYKVII